MAPLRCALVLAGVWAVLALHAATVAASCPSNMIVSPGTNSSCVNCVSGTIPAPNQTVCIACPVDTYSHEGDTSCTPCETGSTAPEGSNLCTCSTNYFLNTDTLLCEACPSMVYAGLVLALTILGMVFVIYFITGEGKAQAYTGMLRTALKCAMWLYVVVSQSAIPWPPFFQDLYNQLFSWTTIINFQQVSPECFVSKLPYVYEWSFFVVFPAYVYLIVLVITWSRRALRNRRYKKQGKEPDPDEPSLALLIHFNFYTVMVTFTTMYLNQMMAPLRIWAQSKGLSSVVDTNLFWIAIGATVFVILSYLLWVFVLPFSRKSSKWRLFTLVYSDGMYEDEALNKLLILDVETKSFKMCVSLVTALTTLLSLIFTSVRGYVALGVVGNILLVVFQFVVQFLDSATADYQSAVIAFALAAAQLILYLVLAIFKGAQLGRLREGDGIKFAWFAAPTGDTNERYRTANILELCAILVDFTHGLFGYFYAINLIPASAAWASYLCMALAAAYFAVTVVVCVWIMWRENRDAIKRRFAAIGAAIRRMCHCTPAASDDKAELVDEEAPGADAAASTELSKSSAELLVMTASMLERKRRSGASAAADIELVDVQPEPTPVRQPSRAEPRQTAEPGKAADGITPTDATDVTRENTENGPVENSASIAALLNPQEGGEP